MQNTMTNATMALGELAEKGPDVDLLRQMVQFMAQRVMDMDVETLCGAGYDEKSAERVNSRNGVRERAWETSGGRVELKIPKLRQDSYSPASWSRAARPRRRWLRSSRKPTLTACKTAADDACIAAGSPVSADCVSKCQSWLGRAACQIQRRLCRRFGRTWPSRRRCKT